MRRKRKRVILVFLGSLFLFIILPFGRNVSESLYETISSLVCDEKRGKSILRELCNAYNGGKVAGNLCADLCKKEQVVIEQCLSHKNDNVIFSAYWRKQEIILKAKRMSSHSPWEVVFQDSSFQNISALQKSFLSVVYDHITIQLIQVKDGVQNSTKLSQFSPRKLVAQLYFNASVASLARNEMKSLWMLLQQDEYFLMQLLKDFKHIPRIYGTCGQFYAMERVKTLNDFVGVGLISAPVSWGVRVELALQLLDLVHELDLKTLYGLCWQHCDIQPSNFGVNRAGVIKAIDVDLMYTDEKLSEILRQLVGNCSYNEDCEFFDCSSQCDVKSKKCTAIRISNNLRVVCRDLFGSKWYEGGLLASIPSRAKEMKFNKILNECSEATSTPWTKEKYDRIFETLQRYLSEEMTTYRRPRV